MRSQIYARTHTHREWIDVELKLSWHLLRFQTNVLNGRSLPRLQFEHTTQSDNQTNLKTNIELVASDAFIISISRAFCLLSVRRSRRRASCIDIHSVRTGPEYVLLLLAVVQCQANSPIQNECWACAATLHTFYQDVGSFYEAITMRMDI